MTSESLLVRGEIDEQPCVWRAQLRERAAVAAAAAEILARAPGPIQVIGHGSSAHAGGYGIHALGQLARRPAFRPSISLALYYGTRLRLEESAVIALSQSGETPDVVEYVVQERRRGALTIAITNSERSPLAAAADVTLVLQTGEERALAATKTYTAQLVTLALLAAELAGCGDEVAEGVDGAASLAVSALPRLEAVAQDAAAELESTSRMFVVGRGAEFATARETALKLTEMCKLVAAAMTTTDLQHGPFVAAGTNAPVWIVLSHDPALKAAVQAAGRIRSTGALLLTSGDAADTDGLADVAFRTPRAPSPLLSPLLSILPAQLLGWALSTRKGIDIRSDGELTKVTHAL